MRGIGGSTLRGGQTVFHAHPHVGPAVPGGHAVRGLHDGGRAGLERCGTVDLRCGVVRRRHGDAGRGQAGRSATTPIPARRCGSRTARGARSASATSPPPSRPSRRGSGSRPRCSRAPGSGPLAGGGLIALFLVVFWYPRRPARAAEAHQGRGDGHGRRAAAAVADAPCTARSQAPAGRQAAAALFSIAGIPYPERTETQHTIVSGTTGSGKTVLISDLVSQIRAKRRALRRLRQDGLLHPGPSSTPSATCC